MARNTISIPVLLVATLLCGSALASQAIHSLSQATESDHEAPQDEPGEAADNEPEPDSDTGEPAAPVSDLRPWLSLKLLLAGGLWDGALGAEVRPQQRWVMKRADSILYQDTYVGVGGRLRLTPAYIDVGPRFSIQPIDFFELEFQASWRGLWRTENSVIPYTDIVGRSDEHRDGRADEAFAFGQYLTLDVMPNLKGKVGPVFAFVGWSFYYVHGFQPEDVDTPYFYEASTGSVVAWDDVVSEGNMILGAEILKGGDGPWLAMGAHYRDRRVVVSKDQSLAVGLYIGFVPGPKPGWPRLDMSILEHVKDVDRQFQAPNITGLLTWTLEYRKGPEPIAPSGH